jgi:hypothetical protein
LLHRAANAAAAVLLQHALSAQQALLESHTILQPHEQPCCATCRNGPPVRGHGLLISSKFTLIQIKIEPNSQALPGL